MARAAWILLLAIPACWPQAELDPDVLRLARIRVRMEGNLKSLPNYTCLQTIERTVRRHGSRRFQLVDTMRLEVALVNGKELFAWPGAGRFEDREIKDFAAPGGAIGNGVFALHARGLFLSTAPIIRFAGRETLNGRAAVRYDYSVAEAFSGFQIRVGAASATVAYRGSFWADEESLDLLRLEVHAEQIPPYLGLASSSDSIEYARVRIGDAEFLLPSGGELTMVDISGNENRNRIRFSGCRHYAGESVISFGEPPPAGTGAAAEPAKPIELPAGLPVVIELITQIDSQRSAIGDPVRAKVTRDARIQREIIVPKGAVLSGRLTRLDRHPGIPGRPSGTHYLVGIEFDTLEYAARRGEFLGELEDVGPVLTGGPRAGNQRPAVVGRTLRLPSEERPPRPGTGLFLVKGDTIRLGPGLSMEWRTGRGDQR